MSSPSQWRLSTFGRLRRWTLGLRAHAERAGLLPLWLRIYEPLRAPVYRWLRPRGEMQVRAQGFTWTLDAGDAVVARNLLTYGEWEPEETALLLGCLKPGHVVVDVGANFGYYTLLAARQVGPTGHVFAFEPAPRNHELLRRHLAENGVTNVTAEAKAVGRQAGRLTLYLSEGNFGAHSVGRGNVTEGTSGQVDVEVTSLDAYFATAGGRRIDVLKMDAQGAEAGILEGATATLGGSHPMVIIMEFWPLGLRGLGADPASVLAQLSALGFRVRYLDGTLRDLPESAAAIALAESRQYLTLVAQRG